MKKKTNPMAVITQGQRGEIMGIEVVWVPHDVYNMALYFDMIKKARERAFEKRRGGVTC